jgi:hypothetical protein
MGLCIDCFGMQTNPDILHYLNSQLIKKALLVVEQGYMHMMGFLHSLSGKYIVLDDFG